MIATRKLASFRAVPDLPSNFSNVLPILSYAPFLCAESSSCVNDRFLFVGLFSLEDVSEDPIGFSDLLDWRSVMGLSQSTTLL